MNQSVAPPSRIVSNPVARVCWGALLMAIGLGLSPQLARYSDSLAYSIARYSADELEFGRNIISIVNAQFDGIYAFGYGVVYWILSAMFAAPWILLGDEQVFVLALRGLSLLFALGSFALLARILVLQGVAFLPAAIFLVLAAFAPIHLQFATQIHPETMYCFFLCLSWYLLVRDQKRFGSNFYFALLSLCIAISVKLLSIFFVIIFLVYLADNWRLARFSHVCRSLFLAATSLLLMNFPLLDPLQADSFFGDVLRQSQIVRDGWMPEQSVDSLTLFSTTYFDLALFLPVLLLTLCFAIWRGTQDESRVFDTSSLGISLAVVAYFLFATLYAHTPGHYGLPIIYLFPLMLGRVYLGLPKLSFQYVFLGAVLAISAANLTTAITILAENRRNEQHTPHSRALNALDSFVTRESLPNTSDIVFGVSHYLALSVWEPSQPKFERLWVLMNGQLQKFDYLAIWKQDRFYRMLWVNQSPGFESTYQEYQRFMREVSQEGSRSGSFVKVFEDDQLVIYRRQAHSE